MTTDIIIAEFPKNGRETIRVAVGEFKGHQLVHIRSWTEDHKQPGEMIPTRHGLSLRRELVPALIDGLQKALASETPE